MAEISKKITSAKASNIIFKTETRGHCPEWWGMNESICQLADEFSFEGFKVLVPDLYRGKVAKDTEEAGHLLTGLQWPGAIEDIKSALAYLLQTQSCSSVGILGFCMGGALTFASLSAIEGFSCGSPFYGICDQNSFPVGKIRVPILAHFGENDELKGFSDPESAKNLRDQAYKENVDFRLRLYPAGHAFMNRDRPDHFSPVHSAAAFKETVEFFKQNLKV